MSNANIIFWDFLSKEVFFSLLNEGKFPKSLNINSTVFSKETFKKPSFKIYNKVRGVWVAVD